MFSYLRTDGHSGRPPPLQLHQRNRRHRSALQVPGGQDLAGTASGVAEFWPAGVQVVGGEGQLCFTIVMSRVRWQTSERTEVFVKSVLGQGNPSLVLVG